MPLSPTPYTREPNPQHATFGTTTVGHGKDGGRARWTRCPARRSWSGSDLHLYEVLGAGDKGGAHAAARGEQPDYVTPHSLPVGFDWHNDQVTAGLTDIMVDCIVRCAARCVRESR